MTNTIITSDIWSDSEYYTVYLYGGSWETDSPLQNLRDERNFNKAISTNTNTTSTQFEVFLGGERDVRIVSIPDHNLSMTSQIRIIGSNSAEWSGVTLNSSVSGGSSSISVLAGSAGAVIQSGDRLGIDGDDTIYTVGSNHTISGGGTATVSISPNKVGASQAGQDVYSLNGNFEQETNLFVDGSHASALTSISIEANSLGGTLDQGAYFTIEGRDGAYRVTQAVTVSPSGAATLTFSPALEESLAGGEEIFFTEYDSGWFSAIPIIPYGSQPWGTPNLLTGTMTDEQRRRRIVPVSLVFDSVIAAYWKIQINDQTNTDGFVSLNRLIIAPGIEFSLNPIYGAQVGVSTDTRATRSLGGTDFYQVRGNRKTFSFTFNNLSMNELYSSGLDLMLDRGIDKQVFVILNPSDTENVWRNSMLATMKQLSPLQYDSPNYGSKAYELEQVI